MFVCDKRSFKRLSTVKLFQRIYFGLNCYFVGIWFTNVPYRLMMETVLTGMTGFVTIVHGGLILMNRRLVNSTTLAIEFDVDDE